MRAQLLAQLLALWGVGLAKHKQVRHRCKKLHISISVIIRVSVALQLHDGKFPEESPTHKGLDMQVVGMSKVHADFSAIRIKWCFTKRNHAYSFAKNY